MIFAKFLKGFAGGALVISHLAQGQEAGLRAGAAKVDITPAQPCLLSGYASRTNLSTGVHDPLSARVVAFEHNGRRLVLVSTDVIGYSSTAITITVARVGDVAMVGLSAEVFHELGRAIKAASPFPHTLVITHCNGGSGYLVASSAYSEGGYEVNTSPFAPEAADLVVKEVAGLLQQLKAK